MIRIIQKHFSVHRRNIQVTVTKFVAFICAYTHKIIIYTIINYILLGSIEWDQELGKYYLKQNDISYTEDLVDKSIKILPPHVEELKRQVSI